MTERTHSSRVALVTGASKGIGRGIATGLATAGAVVVVGYNTDAEGAEETVSAITAAGGTAGSLQIDLGDLDQCRAAIEDVDRRFGALDCLVNNAARTRFGPVQETTEVDFDDVVNTVLKGPFFLSLLAAERMVAKRGSIVNISSIAVRGIMPYHGAYTAAKGGLESMTRQLAIELAPQVRVNAVAPGATLTDRNLRYSEGFAEQWAQLTPLGRVLVPEDYVGVVNFLTSDASSMITGQVIYVDGGWSISGKGPEMSDFDFTSDKESADKESAQP